MGINLDLINDINDDIYRLKAKIDSPQDITLIQSLYDDLKIRIQTLKTLNTNTSLIDITKDNNQVYTLSDKAIDRVTKSGVYFVSTSNNVTKLPTGLVSGLMTVNYISETDLVFVIIDLDTLDTYTTRGVYAASALESLEWKNTSGSGDGASGFSTSAINDMGTLSFTSATRTINLNKNVTDIIYIDAGREIKINTNLTKIITNTAGLHYVYLEDSVLKVLENLDFNGIKDYYKKCTVCVIYWSVTQNKAIFVNDKRFSTELSSFLKWERNTEKDLFKYNNSVSTNFDLACSASSGTLDSDLDVTIVGGGYNVCGLVKTISNVLPATIPVVHTDATGKLLSTLNSKPFLTAGSGRLAYNNSSGLVEAGNDNYVIYTVILTTDINYPVKMLVGRNAYDSVSVAIASLTDELTTYEATILNNIDFMYLGSVLVKTSNVFTNTYKSGIVAVNGKPFINLKGGLSGGIGGGSAETDFYECNAIITSSYTITQGKNAMTAGPIEIADGVVIEVPDGSTWTIV